MMRLGWLLWVTLGACVFAENVVGNVAGDRAVDEPRQQVFGLWAEPRSVVEVAAVGDSLRMNIVAMLDPLYTEAEADIGTPGKARLDVNNPDPMLRNRPLLGLNLISNYRYDGKQWRGDIYDPESGKVYSSIMSLDKKGRLKMRGYIGVPMMGRTAKFDPVSICEEHIVKMLRMAELPGC